MSHSIKTNIIKNSLKATVLSTAVLAPTQANAIVGGSETGQGYPWMAHIKAALGCGASLIAEDWLMTAAHCVVENGTSVRPETIDVILGKYSNHRSPTQSRDIIVDQVIVHPGYQQSTTTITNDIALLHLATPQQGIQTIRLATQAEADVLKAEANQNRGLSTTALTVMGWGQESAKDPFSSSIFLRSTDVYLQNRCGPTQASDSFCVNHPQVFPRFDNSVSIGFCKGDSGGPLLTTHSGPVQYGIVSGHTSAYNIGGVIREFDCGQGPAHYATNIANMRSFISQYVKLDGSSPDTNNRTSPAPVKPSVTPSRPSIVPSKPSVAPSRPTTPSFPSFTPPKPSVATPNPVKPSNPSIQLPGVGQGNGNQPTANKPNTGKPEETLKPTPDNASTDPNTAPAADASDEAAEEKPVAAGALSSLLLMAFLPALRRRRF